MDSLINETRQGRVYDESKDLRSSLCYYLSIIMVLITFICSSVSLGLCSSVWIWVFDSYVVYHYGEDLHLQVPLFPRVYFNY